MDFILLALQLVLGVALFLVWNWIKGLPTAIHKKQEQLLQQQLSKEIELLKISRTQIQPQKIERFIDFAKLQTDILTNDEFKANIKKNDPDAIAKLRELVVELGIGLFFFASDETIRKYGNWKIETAKGTADPTTILADLGRLMVALRKDVGYEDTALNAHDYLKMFITDWDNIKSQIAT